jgi:D-glutamate cyclase
MTDAILDSLRETIQHDVAQRGLRTDPVDNLITRTTGDFAAACRSMAGTPDAVVAVVTGFFIAHAVPPCGETDGPLGAVFLARALVPLGIRVILASDAFCVRALEAGVAVSGLRKAVSVVTLPSAESAGTLSVAEYWQYFVERTGRLTHLIALERVGPSHTSQSVARQTGADRFAAEVAAEEHDRCHSMRGRDITNSTSPAHRLFESAAAQQPPIVTIGIGDGGNEIGMGKIPWDTIRRNIPNGGLIACRIPTDHLLVAGVSNWGAYALAAGVRYLRGDKGDTDLYDTERERDILQLMVERGPLVDGVSGRPTATVDGLTWEQYAAPLTRIGHLVK